MELKELRERRISGRTWVGRTMRDWRGDLVADLGGEDSLSTQEKALIDLATRTKVQLDLVDVWLFKQPRWSTSVPAPCIPSSVSAWRWSRHCVRCSPTWG
jgi:hypothetical protein